MTFYQPQELLLLKFAPNGLTIDEKNHPEIPMKIFEIVITAKKCFKVEAMHFHVRDEKGYC